MSRGFVAYEQILEMLFGFKVADREGRLRLARLDRGKTMAILYGAYTKDNMLPLSSLNLAIINKAVHVVLQQHG